MVSAYSPSKDAYDSSSLTIVKHVRVAKQMFEDAVEWEKNPVNPFSRINLAASNPRSNVEVSRETIAQLMPHLDPTWQVIVALSRFGGLRCPSEVLSLKSDDIDWGRSRMSIHEPKVEHHEGRGVRSCPIFPELMPYLQDAWHRIPDVTKTEYVVDKAQYRAAANTGQDWESANLRTQLIKRLRKAGLLPWARLFHSMRASRQTELQRSQPIHVVCSWLGNSPRVAERSYFLTSNSDFEKAIQGGTADVGANTQEPEDEEEKTGKTSKTLVSQSH